MARSTGPYFASHAASSPVLREPRRQLPGGGTCGRTIGARAIRTDGVRDDVWGGTARREWAGRRGGDG